MFNAKHYKRIVLIAGGVAALLTAIVVFGTSLDKAYSSAPQKYADTYQSIIAHGKNVTALTAEVQRIISDVNRLDSSHQPAAALAEATRAQEMNGNAKKEALDLTLELRTLVGALNESASFMEKQALFGTVDLEIDLVRAFVGYTQEVDSFLAALKQALASGSYEDRKMVYGKMAAVNDQIDLINRLNTEFLKRLGLSS